VNPSPGPEAAAQTLRHFYQLLGQAVLLPIDLGVKELKEKRWQLRTFADTQTPKYQQLLLEAIKRGGNIGVRLGQLSAGVVSIDIDDDEMAGMLIADNPFLANTLRTRSHRGGNLFLRMKPGTSYPNNKGCYILKTAEGHEYGEWRVGGGEKGAYTVLFGVHPEQDIYEIINDVPVLEIDFAQIKWLGPPPGDEPQPEANKEEPRKLRGASILQFSKRAIDSSKTLLGNRWLSRCCGGFIVAPSGHGKSTLVIQVAILWSCGRVAFGIKPARPLRILIIQAEDDDNDVIEMAQMCDRLNLTEEERTLLNLNTHVEWVNDVAGAKLFPVLNDFLDQFPADLLIINPYTAYQGGDIKDDELNNDFLRVHLSAVMNKYDCGALGIHHSPKTQFQKTEDFSWFDWMYSMSGGAALTNWARAVLVIAPTDVAGTYRFIAAKRFEKIGWQEREFWFAHSVDDGKMLWLPATEDQIASAKTTARRDKPEDILELIPPIDPLLQEKLWILAKKNLHVGKNTARDLVNILIHEEKIFEHKIRREGAKSAVGYAKQPPVKE
jgi:hypothetical protein